MHDPICTDSGNLEEALYGSFLPIPGENLFPLEETSLYERANGPGAVIVKKDAPITINANRDRVQIRVTNKGDRPIQVRRSPTYDLAAFLITLIGWVPLSLH